MLLQACVPDKTCCSMRLEGGALEETRGLCNFDCWTLTQTLKGSLVSSKGLRDLKWELPFWAVLKLETNVTNHCVNFQSLEMSSDQDKLNPVEKMEDPCNQQQHRPAKASHLMIPENAIWGIWPVDEHVRIHFVGINFTMFYCFRHGKSRNRVSTKRRRKLFRNEQ